MTWPVLHTGRVPGPGDSFADHPPTGAATDFEDDASPAGAPEAGPAERVEWAWVTDWRAEGEPTPWASGLALTAFVALIVAVAVWVLSAGLADRPAVAVLANVVVASGLAPAMWLARGLPVLRWLAAGTLAGILIGWVSALSMLPLPAP